MAEPDPEFTEYQLRVNKLRLSFKIKNRQHQQQQEIPESPSLHPAYRPPLLPSPSAASGDQVRHFRSRLSSTSSITSTDSGIGACVNVSRASSSASKTGGILRRIARAKEPTKRADAEFEGFYRRPVSRTSSTTSTQSGISVASPNSRRSVPVTNPRFRSKSCSSGSSSRPSSGRGRLFSDDSYAEYSDLYDEVEEYNDPFDDNKPPPLPPRRAVLRPPALPPYPSTLVSVVNKITSSILC